MTRDQRPQNIELPLKITLTNEGEYFFHQKKSTTIDAMTRRLREDPSRIALASYSARSLQWMIYVGYISQIEVTRTDFNSKRGELMDLAKLISYTILRKDYLLKLAGAFQNAPIIHQWNRRNPTRNLDLETMVQTSSSKRQLPREASFQSLLKGIIWETFDSHREIVKNITDEERKILQYKAENFLKQLNSLVWALSLSAMNDNTPAFRQVAQEVRDILWGYLQKTNIADYLGLLILELASMIEKKLVEKAVSTYLKGRVNLEHFIRNKRDRKKILDSLEAHNERASLIWQIQGRQSSATESKPLYFIVSNHTFQAKSFLESLEGKKQWDTEGRNLVEFYEKQGDQELGLFYLNYLQEECQRLGTHFSSYANQVHWQAPSLVNLSVRF